MAFNNEVGPWKPEYLEGDSWDYEYLREAAMDIKDVSGMVCEIGLRRGGGCEAIMSGMIEANDRRVLVGVDPFGNIDYYEREDSFTKLDYTNNMRSEFIVNAHTYAGHNEIHLMFFNMEDTEFFDRFSDGVPYYNEEKYMLDEYALVHFDGPHNYDSLKNETDWFNERAQSGAYFVYDDVVGFYDHDKVEAEVILPLGFDLVIKGQRKAVYRKQ
jgi:hypothetical protein